MASRRVLVVDDNIEAAHSIAVLLRMSGHQVHTAHDGLTAIVLARQFRPHVIFMDLWMPGMNGFDVAKQLRTDLSLALTKIIAVTAYASDEARTQSQAAGFDLHLVKPADPAFLESLLGK